MVDIIKLLRRAYRAYCRKKNWQRMVRAMAMVVVFCTTYALILPAITMESGTICGFVEHTHTDACYAPVTEPGTHVHGDECYAKKLICKLEEVEEHSHSDGCKGIVTTLVCTENHEHIGTCYLYEEGYICGLEETEGHSHGDACWEKKLICGQTEMGQLSALSLSSAKIAEEKEETKPVQRELICGLEEHSHSDACYPATEPETTEETELSTGDPEADLETREDWEASMSAVTLTGDWSADILAVAVSQLGYTESQSNYIMDENGQTFHYTRYGQWCGAPYGDWSAKFVSFCLHYAQIDGIEAQQDCGSLWNAVKDADMLRMPGEYTPVIGDLVFVDAGEDCVCDAIGIVEKLEPETEEQAETITFIAGDWEGRVERVTMEAQDAAILGYAVLPTKPDDTQEHTYTGEDGTRAQVELDALTTSVPEDAVLSIAPLTEEAEEYAPLQAQVEALVSEEILGMTMLDISFYDAQGEYISVSDTARVSLTFPGNAFGDNAVKVFHFTDAGPTELSGVSYYYEYETAEDGTESMYTVLSFDTEGFSVFAVTKILNQFSSITIQSLQDLDGNSYYIVNGAKRFSLQDEAGTYTYPGLKAKTFSSANVAASLADSTYWTFLMQQDGTFLLKSDENRYLVMKDENIYTGVARVDVTNTNDEASATRFTVRIMNNNTQVEIGYDGPNAIAHYLNVFEGDKDFLGWKDSGGVDNGANGDSGSRHYLYLAKSSSGTIQTVNGLAGQEFAIVSNVLYNGLNKSLATTEETVNGVKGLTTINTQKVVIDNVSCVDGEAILWSFEATGTEGTYYISTTVNGSKKYLRMLDNHFSGTPDGRGSLTLGDEGQPITVIANGDGTVSLSVTVTDNGTNYTGYINLDTASYNFWVYKENVESCKLMLCRQTNLDSSFGLFYGTYTVTFNLQDVNGNKLYSVQGDKTVDASETVAFGAEGFAPAIDGYALMHATYQDENGQRFIVTSLGPVGTGYRIYDANYDAINNPNQYHTMNRDSEITLVYRVDVEPILNYSYSYDWKGDGWVTDQPSITAETQLIATDPANLYTVSGRNAAGKFIRDTIHPSARPKAETYWTQHNASVNNDPTNPGYLPPGAEYQFLYWVANNIDNEECYFLEDAQVYLGADGLIRIQDKEGFWQTVWPGTTLRGEWDMLSNIIYFFVNHGDTMLQGEDNQKITSTYADYYTEVAAIGHIYNLDKLSHDNHYAADGTIRIATHEEIEAIFAPVYDPNSQQPQVVVDAVTKFNSSGQEYYDEAPNYNDALLEAAVAVYIQSQKGKTIKLDGAILDQNAITPDNYMLYWYGLKQVDTDSYSYHMDGVLVAKTTPVYIYKTFSGLPNHMLDTSPVNTLISQMQFPLYLLSKNSNGVWTRDSYTTLLAGQSQTGVYSADGWQRDSSNIYQWTLQMVLGQTYAFEETNHTLDGYECFSLISVHYNDPSETVVYEYNTTRSFKDIGTGSDNVPIEDLFNNGKDSYSNSITTEKGVEGGKVKSITFANFYTRIGTGMFSISKTADDAGQVRLPGATFVLKKKSDNTVVSSGTTNEYGSIHFSELDVGTYVLEETSPPPGYQKDNTKWQVEVQKDGTTFVSNGTTYDKVVVTIQPLNATGNLTGSATTVYDNQNGGITYVYQIKNEPINTTVEVNKYFNGITAEEVRRLYGNDATWTEGDYYIEVLDSTGNPVTTTETVLDANGDSQTVTKPLRLTLEDAHPMPGMLYNWTLELPEGTYTFKEHNFLYSSAYLDTMVTVTTDGGCTAGAVVKSDSTPDNGNAEHDLATFTVTKSGAAGTVNITNAYTNTFTLRIHKVDATNGNAPIQNVQLKIFGDFDQASGTESTTYTDANGVEHTVYLVQTLTTDPNGLAVYDKMRLSAGSRTFLYVIKEVLTPEGYVELTDPIVKVVSIDSENYANGVYNLTIENVKEELIDQLQGKITVTAKKQWDLPAGLSTTPVKIHLYQLNGTNYDHMGYVELDGTNDGGSSNTSAQYEILDGGWTVQFKGLEYTDYYIREEHVPGYHTTYSTYLDTITVNKEQIQVVRVKEGTLLARTVTITNTSGYELPQTGGGGTRWMAPLGLMLILAVTAVYWLGIEKKKQGGVDSS